MISGTREVQTINLDVASQDPELFLVRTAEVATGEPCFTGQVHIQEVKNLSNWKWYTNNWEVVYKNSVKHFMLHKD